MQQRRSSAFRFRPSIAAAARRACAAVLLLSCAALVAAPAAAQTTASAATLHGAAAPGGTQSSSAMTWVFDQTTTGADVHWVSPTAVDPGAAVYNTEFALTSVLVGVTFLNIPFGPFDVTSQIPPEQLGSAGPIEGPAPFTLLADTLAYPAPPAAPSISALVTSGLEAGGFGFLDATGIVLGTLAVDLGFPFGVQNVQIKSVRIIGSLTIHATWFDAGHALAGSAGAPLLAGSGTLAGGEPLALSLSAALPGAGAWLVVGFTTLHAPLKGGILVPDADLVIAGLPVDAFGDLLLPALWPAGLPSDVALHFQFWLPDPAGVQGFAASNGLTGVTP